MFWNTIIIHRKGRQNKEESKLAKLCGPKSCMFVYYGMFKIALNTILDPPFLFHKYYSWIIIWHYCWTIKDNNMLIRCPLPFCSCLLFCDVWTWCHKLQIFKLSSNHRQLVRILQMSMVALQNGREVISLFLYTFCHEKSIEWVPQFSWKHNHVVLLDSHKLMPYETKYQRLFCLFYA